MQKGSYQDLRGTSVRHARNNAPKGVGVEIGLPAGMSECLIHYPRESVDDGVELEALNLQFLPPVSIRLRKVLIPIRPLL